MKQTVNRNNFHDAFKNMGRGEQFSYEALNALYDYLEEAYEGCDEEYELDVVALCCEYAEDSIANVLKAYSLEFLEELEQATQVIWEDGDDVLYAQY